MGLNLLLDTHIVIWMATAPGRISDPLRDAIESARKRYVSLVTAWEIQIKNRKRPNAFRFSLKHLQQTMREFACTELPISFDDINAVGTLSVVHDDPFDQLLMAQASTRAVYLATLDTQILNAFHATRQFSIFTDRRMPRQATKA